jgi:hypothetical protein
MTGTVPNKVKARVMAGTIPVSAVMGLDDMRVTALRADINGKAVSLPLG